MERNIIGFGNPSLRLSVNFYGAPALNLKEFARYQQDLIVGASLRVFMPWSQYDPSRLINIGTNRWAFKPELGLSKALDRWTLEGQAAATFYTDNTDFFGGKTRKQDPLYSLQGHVIYSFRSGIWTSLDATYFTGGRTTIDGIAEGRSAGQLASRRDAGVPARRPQLHQALRQQRGVGAHRQQFRPAGSGLAVPVGRRAVRPARPRSQSNAKLYTRSSAFSVPVRATSRSRCEMR